MNPHLPNPSTWGRRKNFPNLRLPFADWDDTLHLNQSTGQIDGPSRDYFRLKYYYAIERFNVTYVPMNTSIEDLSKDGGLEYINSVQLDQIDACPQLTVSAKGYPSNITIGPWNRYYTCKITTFPEAHYKVISGSAVSLLSVFSPAVVCLYLAITMVSVISTLIILGKLPKSSVLNPSRFWLAIVSLCEQKIPIPMRLLARLPWAVVILSTLQLQILAMNMIDIYWTSLAQFTRVDTLGDIVNQKLTPVISQASSCYHTVDQRNSTRVRDYFEKNMIVPGLDGKHPALEIADFAGTHELEKVAILWSRGQLSRDVPLICTKYPKVIISQPSYHSKRPFVTNFNFIIANKQLNRAVKRRLFRFTYSNMEMGLFENFEFLSVARLFKNVDSPNTECMFSTFRNFHASFYSLNIFYYKYLVLFAGIGLIMGTTLFTQELSTLF